MSARRFVVFIVIAAAVVAVFAGTAFATRYTYWGYSTINNSNPAAGTCPSSIAGIACDGFNYWDQNEIAQNSGGYIIQGFQNTTGGSIYGIVRACCAADPNPWELAWNDSRLSGAVNHYNRTACSYDFFSGNPGSYIQCRSLIFP
jgi:hypothetical protein